MAQEKKDKKERHVRTPEERLEALETKKQVLLNKIANRGVKSIWKSEFRAQKKLLHKDKTLTYVQKMLAFRDWIEAKVSEIDQKGYQDIVEDEETEDSEEEE